MQRLDADRQAAAAGRLPTAGIPCQPGAPARLIVIRVHVMDGPLQRLYDWAAIGTTLVVGD